VWGVEWGGERGLEEAAHALGLRGSTTFSSHFAKVNSCTNPSTYPLLLLT